MANKDRISDLMKRAAPYLTRMSDDVASDTVAKEIDALILALESHKASVDHEPYDHTWAGNNSFIKNILVNTILPLMPDTYDIGSDTYRFRKGFFSELSSLIFKKENVVIMDGQFLVTKVAGALAATALAGAGVMDFGREMIVGDFVLFRGEGKIEYVKVGSAVIIGQTLYNVSRDLDGSGANDWPEGTPFAVLGSEGEGWLELNAIDRKRFSVWAQGSDYNNSLEIGRFGDITGWQNAPYTGMGIALGDYANGKYLLYTKTDGMIVKGGTIIAGDGKVIIDENGLRLFTETVYNDYTSPSSIKFIHDGVNFGGIYGSGSPSDVGIQQKIYGAPGQIINNWDIAVAKDTGVVYKLTNAMREGVYGNSYILDVANYEAEVSESESLIEIKARHSLLDTDPVVYYTALLKIWARVDESLIALTAEKIDLTAPNGIIVTGTLKDQSGVEYLKTTGKAADSNKLDGKTFAQVMLSIYPVGAIFMSSSSTNPGTLFGGTWEEYGQGRVLVGKATSGTFATAGSTGGAETHSHGLSAGFAKIASSVDGWIAMARKAVSTWTITHKNNAANNATLGTISSGAELGGTTDSGSTLQPYVVVYMWRRTA